MRVPAALYPQLVAPPASERFDAAMRESARVGYVTVWLGSLREPSPRRFIFEQAVKVDPEQMVACPVEDFEDCVGPLIVRGEYAVAGVIVEATLAHNPVLVAAAWDRWESSGRHADDDEASWQRGYERTLAENPSVHFALLSGARGRQDLLRRAGLDRQHREVAERFFAGEQKPTTKAIAQEFLISREKVRTYLEEISRALAGLASSRSQAVS